MGGVAGEQVSGWERKAPGQSSEGPQLSTRMPQPALPEPLLGSHAGCAAAQ